MKKRITTETIYDDNGRVLKTIVTEEYDEDPLQNPYGYPYCDPSDNITYANGSIPKGAITCH